MAKNKVITRLVCGQCKERNYTQRVSKKRTVGSLKLSKFCSKCRGHKEHKESK
ncbi:MAG TPA: 50S ribosomal protein L33 [Patescibacteria group bacterium]|nr:50S ribosomal protein L33 [Patescibacteria group bacterium]